MCSLIRSMEEQKKVAWFNESLFLPLHVHCTAECVCFAYLRKRWKAGGGSEMPRAVFYWETLGRGIHVDGTLIHIT